MTEIARNNPGASREKPRTWVNERTFIKAYRNPDALALLRSNKNAFCLLYVIAFRARRCRDGFNEYNLAPGEAFLGDFENYDMTEKEYRVAKEFLQKHGYAAFRRASRGTIATLLNSSIFDINAESQGEKKGDEVANKGRSEGGQRATNKNGEEGTNGKKVPGVPLAEEVLTYGRQLGKSDLSIIGFINHYLGCGWIRNDQPVDWQTLLKGWKE